MADIAKATELQEKLLGTFGEAPGDLQDPQDATRVKALIRYVGTPAPASAEPQPLLFDDRNTEMSDGVRFMNALATLLVNCDEKLQIEGYVDDDELDDRKPAEKRKKKMVSPFGGFSNLLEGIGTLTRQIDEKLRDHLDAIFHDDDFQGLEASWRGLSQLASSVESNDVIIDFLDVGQKELGNDLCDHEADLFGGELFKKVYVEEYDRYGGKPFAAMIGLYEFGSEEEDINWLRAMGKLANASHCPFIAAAAPTFFKPSKTMQEVADIGDLDAVLSHPRFGKWNELRDTPYAAYLGLVLPRYLLRKPFDGAGVHNAVGYKETVHPGLTGDATHASHFLWGNAAILFARNMVRSYEASGWAQHIRGPKGGGLVEGLTIHTFTKNGYEEIQPPVEIAIPDYRERQFSENGFIALVHKKNEAVATFFSAQSIKKPRNFVEDLNTKNAYLVTNLAYTFSITRIAHYVKRMMREYIGSTADGAYIQRYLANWLGGYVTVITNPDDLTLLYYPFKAVNVTVEPKPGPFGWYKSVISVLPHAQFEGMDVELRLEAALGGP